MLIQVLYRIRPGTSSIQEHPLCCLAVAGRVFGYLVAERRGYGAMEIGIRMVSLALEALRMSEIGSMG